MRKQKVKSVEIIENIAGMTSMSLLNNESLLVLKLSGYYENKENFPVKVVKDLMSNCDIQLFQKKLNQARTWPMVYQNIKTYQIRLPETVYQSIKKKAKRTIFQSLKHHRLLKQLQQEFWKKNIPCFSLKGTLLAKRLMGRIGLRHSIDIDLLVHPERLTQARVLLKKLGYECLDKRYFGKLDHKQIEKFLHHSVFHHKQTDSLLELHWRLSRFRDDMRLSKKFWDGFELTKNTSCQLLPDDELFLYLCWHGSKHFWRRLKWLVDIHLLILQNEWDWQQLLFKAYEYRCERSLALSVVLIHELYHMPLPQELEIYLKKQPSIYLLAQKTIASSFNADNSADNQIVVYWMEIKSFWNKIQLCSSYSCKIQISTEFIRPRWEDMHAIHLPRALFFIYYFIRPVRIIYDIFKSVLKKQQPAI